MKAIRALDATAAQLATYIELHGVEVANSQRHSKDELLLLLKDARLPDPILVDDERREPSGARNVTNDLSARFAEPFDFDDEQWCRVRFGLDTNAEDKHSAIPISVESDLIWCRRGVDLVFRERFLRVVHDSKERRVTQNMDAEGNAVGRFSEATVTEEYRHPFQFLGFCGRVADGPPELLDESRVTVIR